VRVDQRLLSLTRQDAAATIPINGWCDAHFWRVREAFTDNFTQRAEHGAAVCVAVEGRVAVDLWGGYADAARSRPWERDTLVNVFSVGKAMTAVCLHRLVGQARLSVDDAVALYWPEFAAAGKEAVTVRQLLSHQAGLPAVRRRLPVGAMFNWRTMTAALAAQEPWWEPGTAHGYHVNTFGFLVGEVVRRITGRTLGSVFRDEVAGPLGADVHIGLDKSADQRVAEFLWSAPAPPSPEPAGLSDDQLMELNAYFNPTGLSGAGVVNTRQWRAAEIPSTNGHASARGVARVYDALAAGGVADKVRVVDSEALAAAAVEQVYGEDRILHRPSRYGLGFQLTQDERPLGPNPGAFGHFGVGGSLGFCDPDAGVAFGYVMNDMGPRWQNPRNRALINSVYESIAP
jgi:CubicO group peptidase (beta-lactamase class C family)